MRKSSYSLPVLLAACFLLVSCLLFLTDRISAKHQAEGWLRELYTVSRQHDLADWYETERAALYESRFGARMTDSGKEALLTCCLPYVLLTQPGQVERSYVKQLELEELPGAEEALEAGRQPASVETDSSGRRFRYRVWIDVTLDRGIEVLAPVKEQSYTGIICLAPDGHFGWKFSGITID